MGLITPNFDDHIKNLSSMSVFLARFASPIEDLRLVNSLSHINIKKSPQNALPVKMSNIQKRVISNMSIASSFP